MTHHRPRNRGNSTVVSAPTLDRALDQVVLDGRVRQAEAVGGGLIRPGVEDGRHDQDLSVCGASGEPAVPHASRLATASHSSGFMPWPQATDWAAFEAAAKLIEKLGCDHVWTWDHPYAIFGDR